MTRPRYTKDEVVELVPDAWERFGRAVTAIAKAKPIHRQAKVKKRSKRARAKS
jgi:hypothetical protein